MHPWIWLNEPQHAAAVEALGALIGVPVAVGAFLYAASAYSANSRQLTLTEHRLALEKQKYETETARLAEERAAAIGQAQRDYEQRVAEEDAARPRFQFGGCVVRDVTETEMTNIGGSPALNLEVRSAETQVICGRAESLAPQAKLRIVLRLSELQTSGLLVSFRTKFGSSWKLQMHLDPTIEVMREVSRTYFPQWMIDPERIAP